MCDLDGVHRLSNKTAGKEVVWRREVSTIKERPALRVGRATPAGKPEATTLLETFQGE